MNYFYPHSPCGERLGAITYVVMTPDFYPHSPCGERPGGKIHNPGKILFLSTLSLRRATRHGPHLARRHNRFLSTLSLRRATWKGSELICRLVYFYPHSPCGERHVRITHNPGPCYFYPHSPCGERLYPSQCRTLARDFYPHSPCGERPNLLTLEPSAKIFLSTLSLRRATVRCFSPAGCWRISIHTLLAESDVCLYRFSLITLLISIHTLLAESDYDTSSLMQCQVKFLSTLSLRRATRR